MPPVVLLETPGSAEVLDTTQEVVSNLYPYEHIAMQKLMQTQQALQESIQREAQTFRAVEPLNTLAAQVTAKFQRLAEPVASLIQQATAAPAHTTLLIETSRIQELLSARAEETIQFQKMLSSIAEENTRFQQFHKELSIAPLWEEENKRLQKMAASFQVMRERVHQVFRVEEHLQRAMSAFQPLIASRWKEEQEQLQRLAASFQTINARLQQEALQNYEWLKGLAASVQVPHIYIDPAAFERRMCADALEAFSYEPDEAKWFVTQVLQLHPSFLCAVWEALRDGRWMMARRPLRYVWSVAKRIYKRDAMQTGSMFNSALLSLDAPVSPSGTLLHHTLPTLGDPLGEQEDRCDQERLLEQQGLSAGLSPDALTVYKLREIHGKDISRRALPDLLQWPSQRVERAWREVCRKIGGRKK